MLRLSLRSTIIGERPLANDFSVIWTSVSFGARRVGRFRLATEHRDADTLAWSINPPMPVPAWCHGIARSRELARAAFRRAFERFHSETTARQWADAFATQRTGEERHDRISGADHCTTS
jgi:hypothetical protein